MNALKFHVEFVLSEPFCGWWFLDHVLHKSALSSITMETQTHISIQTFITMSTNNLGKRPQEFDDSACKRTKENHNITFLDTVEVYGEVPSCVTNEISVAAITGVTDDSISDELPSHLLALQGTTNQETQSDQPSNGNVVQVLSGIEEVFSNNSHFSNQSSFALQPPEWTLEHFEECTPLSGEVENAESNGSNTNLVDNAGITPRNTMIDRLDIVRMLFKAHTKDAFESFDPFECAGTVGLHTIFNRTDWTAKEWITPLITPPCEDQTPTPVEEVVPSLPCENSPKPPTSLESKFKIAAYGTQGQRMAMEDVYQVIPFSTGKEASTFLPADQEHNCTFFAVFDGHGGNEAAKFVSSKLHNNIIHHPLFSTNTEDAIREGFLQTEVELEEETTRQNFHGGVGSTACVGIICNDTLYVASVGDSTAVLSCKGKPVRLIQPHTLKNSAEKERIKSLGGVILNDHRLGHPLWSPHFINIGVTRAFGDFYFKKKEWTDGRASGLIAEPEVVSLPISTELEFLLMATDGFWDVVGEQKATQFVSSRIRKQQDPTQICKELTDLALKKGSQDNTTVLIVQF